MDVYLQEELENVRVVDTKRDYWFIRSYGGELFDNFIEDGYVGLGLNNVPYKYILNALEPKDNTFENLQKYINENTQYKKKEATKWANQLISFEHDVKVGDIVITPNKNSRYLAFGIVKSNTYLESKPGTFKFKNSFEAFPEKRKRIDWLKIISREALHGDLLNLLTTQQAITFAKRYSETIEGNLSSLYIKDNRIYLTIKINQDEDINAFDLNRFLTSLTFFYTEFCKENGIEDNEDLTIKIKLQSRGKLALQAFGVAGLLGIGGLFALSNNPEISAEYDGKNGKFSAKSTGFLQSISDFLDSDQKRKMEYEVFQDSLRRLKVKTVIDGIEDKNQKIDTIVVVESTGDYIITVKHDDKGDAKNLEE